MDHKGIVATIIAGSLGGGFMMIIVAMALRDRQLTDKGGEVMIALVSGLLTALGFFMGSKER